MSVMNDESEMDLRVMKRLMEILCLILDFYADIEKWEQKLATGPLDLLFYPYFVFKTI